MRLINADELFINLDGMMAVSPTGYIHGDTVADMISDAPTVDAIPCDDNFGFAGYIVEKNELGIRVEETWNTDLTDEEMMYVMCGIIQDINEDERLKKLWKRATAMAEFLGEENETD